MKSFSQVNKFLFEWDSSLDLELNFFRRAITTLDKGVLMVETGCYPIVLNESNCVPGSANIFLGYGFHHSTFSLRSPDFPRDGLIGCLNPPFSSKIKEFRTHNPLKDKSLPVILSFKNYNDRFNLTNKVFDLDKTLCGVLETGERYSRS